MYRTTLIDPARLQQFTLLCGTKNPFRSHEVLAADGLTWACATLEGYLFAVPVRRLKGGLCFDHATERVLWLVHSTLRAKRVPELWFDKRCLRELLFGQSHPQNWLPSLRKRLASLVDLRVGLGENAGMSAALCQSSRIFDRISEVDKGFRFLIADGILGSLAATPWRAEGKAHYTGPSLGKLRELRKQNRVQEVYLPVYLGDIAACRHLTSRQKYLLQAIIRELTHPPRERPPSDRSRSITLNDAQVIHGNEVVGFGGRGGAICPCLLPQLAYLGFNGNGVRRGQGYRLTTWATKGAYARAEVGMFLDDIGVLVQQLGLLVVAVGRGSGTWLDLDRLNRLWRQGSRGEEILEGYHVRIYAPAASFDQWDRKFRWGEQLELPDGQKNGPGKPDVLDDFAEVLTQKGMQQTHAARDLGVSKQYLSTVLKRTKPCSDGLRRKIEKLVAEHRTSNKSLTHGLPEPPAFQLAKPHVRKGSDDIRNAALAYYDHGLVVVPIRSWDTSRRCFVKWKHLQATRPTREEVHEWWSRWPDAGIAAVLGPVSNLLCVDVDGANAYRILMELLGEIPLAPTLKSGGKDPYRFHLYFAHPDLDTKASATPWNAPGDKGKLELRGFRGLAVLPPSLHRSGRRYTWVKGRGLDDIKPPPLPDPLLAGLQAALRPQPASDAAQGMPRHGSGNGRAEVPDGHEVAPSTAAFLAGKHAQASGWNRRLFTAACDLNARGIAYDQAVSLLLRGAKPNSVEDEQAARDTIKQAYKEPRKPSRR